MSDDFVVGGRLELDSTPYVESVDTATAATAKLTQGQGAQVAGNATVVASTTGLTSATKDATTATTAAAAAHVAAASAANTRAVAEGSSTRELREGVEVAKAFVETGSVAAAAGSRGFISLALSFAVANPLIAAAGAAFAVVATVVGLSVAQTAAAEDRTRSYALQLQATGNAAGVTASQLEKMVEVEAQRAGANRAQTGQAAATLALNPNLDSNGLAQTLSLARDFAQVSGQDLPQAAATLSKALDGSSSSVRALDQTWNFLSATELAQIQSLEQQGDKAGVVSVAIAALTRSISGMNEQGVTPLKKSVNDLANAWTDLLTKVGNSSLVSSATWTATRILNGAAMLGGSGVPGQTPGPATSAPTGPTLADLSKAKADLAIEESRLQQLVANTTTQNIYFQQPAISAATAKVADLKNQVTQIQAAVDKAGSSGQVTQLAAAAQSAQTELTRQAKDFIDNLAKANTASQQAAALNAQLAIVQKNINSGTLDPTQLQAANELVDQLKGRLQSAITPAQQLAKSLDLQSVLANTPDKDRATLQAYLTTYQSALAASGDVNTATALAEKARQTVLDQQNTATQTQITLLSAEAQSALAVAAAYDVSRTAGLKAAAEQQALQAEQSGSIAPGTAGQFAQDTLEKNATAAISAQAEKNRGTTEDIAAQQRLVAAEAISTEAAKAQTSANQVAALAIQLRAQAEAAGSDVIKAKAEQQIQTATQLAQAQLKIDQQRSAQQLNTQFDPNVAFNQQMANLATLQATGVLTARTVYEATKQYEQQKLTASRDSTDGMIAGLKQYADDATNAGKTASQGVTSGLQSMEDALTSFVTTGTISFSSLTSSILADIARIEIRQSITGPLASALASALGNLGGLFTGNGSQGNQLTTVQGVVNHVGGIVGEGGLTRNVPLSLFANAPRFHSGGLIGADEVPIIAQRGERVLTKEQQASWGGVPQISFSMVNNGSENLQPRQGATSSNGSGGWNIQLILDKVDDGLATRMANGAGKLPAAIEGRYGVRKVPRR